jgi:hypothetical protein
MACNLHTLLLHGIFAISCLLVSPFSLHADDDLDDVLSGFEDTPLSSGSDADRKPTDSVSGHTFIPAWLDITGSLSMAASLNFAHHPPDPHITDHRGVSKLKLSADIHADMRCNTAWQARVGIKGFYDSVYDLQGRNNYTEEFLDEYVKEFELSEVWMQGRITESFDLKIGRQIVVWGKSDNIRITDILNPLDNREPGLVDIKDLRLPVTMTKMDYFSGPWNLSAMVIHEFRESKIPVYGSDFYPGSFPMPSDDKPGISLKNQEYAVAANGIFRGWDLSFYGAGVFDDIAHIEQKAHSMGRKYSRLHMAGSAVNIAVGNWLIKSEAAFIDGIEYSLPVGEKSRLDVLLGAEYTGLNETVISVEAANRHIFSFDKRLENDPVYGHQDDYQTALRVNRDFYNDTLKLTWLCLIFGFQGENGLLQRLTLEYELTTNTNITAGFITYQSGDSAAFQNIGDNDRVFFEVRSYF